MAEEATAASYQEGCPGCRVDRGKAESDGRIPYKNFLYVWMISLSAALPISSLFPYLYFLIRDLHVAKREEDIGFYAGFVGASFMLGRALTAVFWGVVADRYGRKPVFMLGILSVIVFNTLFGLSRSYWMAITTRFLLGALNGIIGIMKAYAIEVAPEEHQTLALSLVTTAWGIGLVIGPALGGYLSEPAEKYPHTFSHASFLGRFPYFLPCLVISVFATCVFVSCIWLPETLHIHKEDKIRDGSSIEGDASTQSACESKGKDARSEEIGSPQRSIFKNWPLMSSIIVYCIFCLHDMAYSEIFSLWAVSDKRYGGLSFSSKNVGEVLAISGFTLLVFQLLIYPRVEKLIGPISSIRVAAVLTIPLLVAYPYMTYLSGLELQLVVNCASSLKNFLSMSIMTGFFILQNNAVSQKQRGAANGFAMSTMSMFKAIAPAGGGAMFSWAQRRQVASLLPGDQIVFFILNAIEFLGLVLTFKFFLTTPK